MTLEPLPPALVELLASEPVAPPLAREASERLFERLDASVGLALAAGPLLEGPGGVAGVAGASVKLAVAAATGVFAAGVLVGAGLHARWVSPNDGAVPAHERPVAPARVIEAETPAPMPPVVREKAPAVNPARVRPLVPASPATTLEAERRLLEPARAALARHLTDNALGLLAAHANAFPSGLLTEEREALWVQALAQAGDLAQARHRAADFVAKYPNSLFAPVVESAALGGVTESQGGDK